MKLYIHNFRFLKNNVKNASTEAVGVVGYGKYKDGSIQSLKIQITASVKSYTELIYVVETVADKWIIIFLDLIVMQ